jgi:hypothetical protein
LGNTVISRVFPFEFGDRLVAGPKGENLEMDVAQDFGGEPPWYVLEYSMVSQQLPTGGPEFNPWYSTHRSKPMFLKFPS